jgi:hypothetical protein
MSKKSRQKPSNKVLIAPVAVFISILLFTVLLIGHAGLVFFNVLFGRPIYGVIITYDLQPYYYGKMLVKMGFTFNLTLSDQPIETILYRDDIQVVGQNPQLDVSALNFELRIPIHIYTGRPQAQIPLYDNTFIFNDNKLRQITVYLLDFDVLQHQEVYVEIKGTCTINDEVVPYESGEMLTVGI